jgi:pimeloyl-ACP methyl ester carboxylesterase
MRTTPALLLHGLAGHAGEWDSTAAWMRERFRVVAVDGLADAASALDDLGEPAVVVGQSLGGLIAIRLAAARPELVCALIVAEASPSPASDPDAFAAEVAAALRRWPVPFASRSAAEAFFGGPSVAASAWAAGLVERDDGLWPRFDVDAEVRMLRDAVAESAWPEWERLACPVLVVRGSRGTLTEAEADAMAARGRDVRVAAVPHAGHDVHLDQPKEWRRVVTDFLDSLEGG